MDFVLRNQHKAKALQLACSLIEGRRCRRHLDELDRLACDAADLFARIAEGATCEAARSALESEGLCERGKLLRLDCRTHRLLVAKPAMERSWAETLSRVQGGARAPQDLLTMVERAEPTCRIEGGKTLHLVLPRDISTYRIEPPAAGHAGRLPRAGSSAIASLEGLTPDGATAKRDLARLIADDVRAVIDDMSGQFAEIAEIVEAMAAARTGRQLVDAFPAAAVLFVEPGKDAAVAPSILKTL